MASTAPDRTAQNRAYVQKSRGALRAGGLRPVQIWIPDLRNETVAAELRRQSELICRDPHEAEYAGLLESAAATIEGWV